MIAPFPIVVGDRPECRARAASAARRRRARARPVTPKHPFAVSLVARRDASSIDAPARPLALREKRGPARDLGSKAANIRNSDPPSWSGWASPRPEIFSQVIEKMNFTPGSWTLGRAIPSTDEFIRRLAGAGDLPVFAVLPAGRIPTADGGSQRLARKFPPKWLKRLIPRPGIYSSPARSRRSWRFPPPRWGAGKGWGRRREILLGAGSGSCGSPGNSRARH